VAPLRAKRNREIMRGLDILKDVYRHSGSRLWLLMALLVLSGVSDGISMALIYPLLASAGIGVQLDRSGGGVAGLFHQVFAFLGFAPTLGNVSLLLIASFLVQSALVTSQNWTLIDIQKKYVSARQRELFSDFIAADWPYLAAQKVGTVVNHVLIECPRLGAAFFAIMQLVVAGIIFSIYIAIALAASWRLMVYLVASGAILFFLVRPIRRASRRYGALQSAINADFAGTLNEVLGGAKLIKASAGEGRASALLNLQIERMRYNATWGAFPPTTLRTVFEFGAILTILGALLYGVEVETIGTAKLLLLVALVARLLPRMMQIQIFHNTLNLCAPAYSILGDMELNFRAHRSRQLTAGADAVDPSSLLPAEIVARDVVVHYRPRAVLDKVSFVVKPGQVVGFVGPSGAGKTTLVDTVLGLIAPDGGAIEVGGVRLDRIDMQAWRRKIGYVSQDTFLFHDTVANNIRWDAPDTPMQAVEAAGRAAGLSQFIDELPRGYDTIVGDRGAKLSGGQRQRISMARALLRDPALLILDEATSSLDSLSEQDMVGVLNSLRGKMSVIVVAHRFTAVRNADYIYVLDQGKIVEEGTWESLSDGQALFRRLMDAQAFDGQAKAEAR
jgi:ATP-binding cassette subfamily C protein